MGVKIKKRGSKWYVYVNYQGRRKNRCIGTREAAERVRREIEARLALGDSAFLTENKQIQTFGAYADGWLKDHARIECKKSTADGYEGVLKQYLRPRFGTKRLEEVRRDSIKTMISDLVAKGLSRNTVRNALCVVRGILTRPSRKS